MRRRSIDLLLSTSPPSQDGWVELEAVEYRSEQRNNTAPITVVQAATKQADTACNIPTEASPLPDPGDVSQRIRLEAERVRSRYQSLVETESEVTLRFDFMTDRDNRVSFSAVDTAMTCHLVCNARLAEAVSKCAGGYVYGVCCDLRWVCHPSDSVYQHYDQGDAAFPMCS